MSISTIAKSLLIASPLLLLPGSAEAGARKLEFCNYTTREISATYSLYDGTTWHSNGWYNLQVNQCKTVATNVPSDIAFYAFSADGWESSQKFDLVGIPVCVNLNHAFSNLDSRVCEGAGGIPAGSQFQTKLGHIAHPDNVNIYSVPFQN